MSLTSPLILPLTLAVFGLTGCTTMVDYTSDIEGASVTTVGGIHYGQTPVRISYDDDELDRTRDGYGCARLPGVVYTWTSGATAASPNPIVLCDDRSAYQVHVARPADAPDIEKDLKLALERQRQREAQLRHELEMEQLRHELYWFGPGFWPYGPRLAPPPPRARPPHAAPQPPRAQPPRHQGPRPQARPQPPHHSGGPAGGPGHRP